jgi:hypothetical protein
MLPKIETILYCSRPALYEGLTKEVRETARRSPAAAGREARSAAPPRRAPPPAESDS